MCTTQAAMMSIKIVFCLVVLMATGTKGVEDDLTGDKYYLYKSGECAHNGSTIIDLSDVPHGSGVEVWMKYGAYANDTKANCSLAFTYNDATTPTLFLAKSKWSIYLGSDTNCLTLYDGKDSTASTKLRKCGDNSGNTVFLTTANSILFSVDTSTQILIHKTTFAFTLLPFAVEANYFMEDYCSPTEDTLVHPNKTIWLHTNRADQYQNYVDCAMTLFTDTDYRLLVRFHNFSLETSDCLTFHDGDGTDGTEIREMCGKNYPSELETYGRFLTVHFKTDSRDKDDGAIMVITSTSEEWECPYSQEFKCEGYPECYNSGDICDGYNDCPDGSDETNCNCDTGVHCLTNWGSYQCMYEYMLCDSYTECLNGADETPELCEPPILSYWSSGQLAGIFIGYLISAALVIAVTCLIQKKCKPAYEN